MIIDAHVHLGFWKNLFDGLGTSYEELDRVLEEEGMIGAVITSTDRRDNEYLIEAKRKGKKEYFPFPWIYRDKKLIEWLDKYRDDIYGIKIHQSVEKMRINSEDAHPFIEWAYNNKKPVIVHCGRWQEFGSYKFAIEAAEQFKDVTFIFSHMGGAFYKLALETIKEIEERKLKNVYLGIEGLMEHWVIKRGIETLGADRIIFGSDYPLSHPRMFIAMLQALRIGPKDFEKITYFNIMEILNS